MAEQLMLPNTDGSVVGLMHIVGEFGAHEAIRIHGLGEASLQAVFDARNIPARHQTYSNIHRINHVGWIDFPGYTLPEQSCALETMARKTFLAVGREQRGAHRYDFVSAQDLLDEGTLPAYTISWLRKLISVDRPHPPMLANRTDTIRDIARLLPPLSRRSYIRLAVSQMPSLKDHYRQFGYRFTDS